MPAGVLTIKEAREALDRAERRVAAQLPGDAELAQIVLKAMQTRMLHAIEREKTS